MSALPGKVHVNGVCEVAGERVFALQLLQARDPSWVGRPFFARFDASARWLHDLRPALGEREWFWERPLAELLGRAPDPDLDPDLSSGTITLSPMDTIGAA